MATRRIAKTERFRGGDDGEDDLVVGRGADE